MSMTDNSALPEIGALVERLRAIPVWMVGEMTPGWQEHGTTAYEAADTLATLLQSLADLKRERDEARARVGELEADLDRERQKVAWPAMYQRYWDGLARIAGLEAALSNLESACDRVAATRGRETYLRMIDHDNAEDALEALDDARRTARSALRTAASSGRG